ncbi:MAG: HD domain-containing protein [Proteobacteria bacterium]|nr:HD domain-containing protein [Pseudomonadota bacterium]MBU1610718.1 HD domain-containing protein [Pseudomonadota bacterium]
MKDERTKNLSDRDQATRRADLVFELGMLRKTPRTGYQFLGTGEENVAEHSFRTALIGWMLAKRAGADESRTTLMCLFHDLAEARTGDFNYVNKMYDRAKVGEAMTHALAGTGLSSDVLPLWQELEATESLEAQLAHDADQLDFVANLKEQQDLGNPYAGEWMEGVQGRLLTDAGRELFAAIVSTDHKDWWFKGPDRSWWATKNGGRE